jgi:hypothetical protein
MTIVKQFARLADRVGPWVMLLSTLALAEAVVLAAG